MWQTVGEVAFDVLMPDGPGPDLERLFDKKNEDQLRVPLIERDGFKRRLNASGWFDEEIVAAGLLHAGEGAVAHVDDDRLGARRAGRGRAAASRSRVSSASR